MIARLILLALVAVAIGGCKWQTFPTSIAGGESKVFSAPPYVVKGRAPYDQNIIDEWVEGGVAAYGWKRPAPRPASLDAPVSRKVAAPVRAKKRGIIKRIKDRVVAPFTKPVAPILETPTAPTPVAPAPLPKPRDPVDDLLHPSVK